MWSYNTIKSLERHAKYEQSTPHHTGEQSSVGEFTITQSIRRHWNVVNLPEIWCKTCEDPFYLLLKQPILFINFLKNTSLFVGPLMYIPVVGFYGRLPWVLKPLWIPGHVLSPVCNGFLWCDICWPFDSQHDSRAFLIHIYVNLYKQNPWSNPSILCS